MMVQKNWLRRFWLLLLVSVALIAFLTAVFAREVPRPSPQHPGNIFLVGEDVVVSIVLPEPAAPSEWQLADYDDNIVARGASEQGRVRLGKLPPGHYALRYGGPAGDAPNRLDLAVLNPLAAPTPANSPICLDVAAAWFYSEEKFPAVANLCALAGVNWVRDRLTWKEMEPERGRFSPANRYDAAARVQHGAGLQVLQVIHSSPSWANPATARFPLDLRDAYHFFAAMAGRWSGAVAAFEPWNEADIDMFGGHLGSEIASLQKAAYWGLKAGNSNIIACQNVFALHNPAILGDFAENQAGAYFDTFNLHHYTSLDSFPQVYAAFRAVSSGKPMWVTECNIPVHWAGDDRLKEPSPRDLKIQSERVAKIFAASIYEGAAATFYFLLPHYAEGQTQFGILRADLTPRPAYVALAAAGRLLAGARPVGRLKTADPQIRGFVIRAKPEGQSRELLVAWTTNTTAVLTLPRKPDALFDHLGRKRSVAGKELSLTPAPLFAIFPSQTAASMDLDSPPQPAALAADKASRVVLQAVWPKDRINLNRSAYRVIVNKRELMPIYAYNFGAASVTGTFKVAAPSDWKTRLPERLTLGPGERARLDLQIDCPRMNRERAIQAIRIEGDFGDAGQAVLSLRLKPEPDAALGGSEVPVPTAEDGARWGDLHSGTNRAMVAHGPLGVTVAASLEGADRWIYPQLNLQVAERLTDKCVAVRLNLSLLEGAGDFRMIFEEENGSCYLADFKTQPKPGETVETLVLLEEAIWGANWSASDPNLKLDPSQVKSIRIGCNTKASRVKFAFKNLRWVTE